MTAERYAEQARRWIRSTRSEAPPCLPGDRRRLVGAVEGALRGRRRKRQVTRALSTIGAAAAAVLLVTHLDLSSFRHQSPSPVAAKQPSASAVDGHEVTVRDGKGAIALDSDVVRTVKPGMMLQPGIELVAPSSGNVQIGTAQGTLLTLESGGTLTVTESTATQRFALLRGAVRARVAKLVRGERFIINSPDAEIEVHGTQFRVALVEGDSDCAEHSMTRVSVTEGVVSVRSAGQEVRLYPGDSWPAGCTSTTATAKAAPEAARAVVPLRPIRIAARTKHTGAAAQPAEAPPPAEAPGAAVAPPSMPAPPAVALPPSAAPAAAQVPVVRAPVLAVAPAPQSHLAEQNDLFAAGIRAKRAGRDTDAIRYFTRLVKRYPNGPNTEAALVQRMRLLAAADAYVGADAAIEYISLFPDGFARAEADRLAAHALANKP